jgi:hypothetical protein
MCLVLFFFYMILLKRFSTFGHFGCKSTTAKVATKEFLCWLYVTFLAALMRCVAWAAKTLRQDKCTKVSAYAEAAPYAEGTYWAWVRT